MLILKWFLIVLVSIDFIADFSEKSKRESGNSISAFLGRSLGLVARAYVVYILITVWQV